MSVIKDWKEVSPGVWTRTVTMGEPWEAWVGRWNGKRQHTPGGVGRIEEILSDPGNGEATIKVRIKADL